MSDERAPKRQQTQTERDLDGLAARRERTRSPARGVPVDFDEITAKYDGEELARMRARRPTDARLAHIEGKYDKLGEKVNEIHVDVAGMRGELKVLPELLDLLKGKERTKRLGMTTRAKVIIAVLGTVSAVLTAAVASMAGCA